MAASNVNQTIIDEPTRGHVTDQAVSGEFVLRDWQFINQSSDHVASSDDESIEIIEREVAVPISEGNSDDSDANDSDVEGSNIHPKPISTDVVDKHIQTNESSTCQSCLQIACTTNVTHVAKNISLKILYSITLCLCISIFIDQYKGYVSEKWFDSFRFKNEAPDPVTFDGFPLPTVPLHSSSSHKVNEPTENLVSRLHLDIVRKKQLLDDTFADQLNILNAVKQLKENIYILNITELNREVVRGSSVSFERNLLVDFLNSANEIPACHYKLKANTIPSVCRADHAIVVLLDQSQLIAAYENFGKFFDEFVGRLEETGENLTDILTQPQSAYDKEAKDSNLVPDCDSFSKFFKSNSFCVEDGSDSAESSTDQADFEARLRKLEERLKETLQATKVSGRLSMIEDGSGANKNRKLTPEMFSFLRQFKSDFEKLYRMYATIDEATEPMNASPGPTEAGEENATSAPKPDVADPVLTREPKPSIPEPISGEWFANMNKARADFRKYYEGAITGDWILKLGKAREKLRKYWGSTEEEEKSAKQKDWLGNLYDHLQYDFEKLASKWTQIFDGTKPKKESRERWYEKTQNKLKDKFKKYSSQWKHNMRKAKEGILNNYEHLQSKLKDVLDGYF